MKNKFVIVFLFLPFILFSQSVRITYNGSRNYTMIERSDLRRYDNGKYVGLVSREVRSFISPVSFDSDFVYEGNFFVEQETRRASDSVGLGIHDSIPSKFEISSDGSFKMLEDNGFPSFRSFPTYSNQKIKKGDTWTAKAERSVDPLNKGIPTRMPIYVQYTYKEEQIFHDEPVYLITAEWATRYGMGSGTSYIDYGGDRDLKKATGSHKANILVSRLTGATLVIRDNVDETFVFADGHQIQLKGTISMFTEYPPAVNREKLLPTLQRVAGLSFEEAQKIKNTPNKQSNSKLESPSEATVVYEEKTVNKSNTNQTVQSLKSDSNYNKNNQNNEIIHNSGEEKYDDDFINWNGKSENQKSKKNSNAGIKNQKYEEIVEKKSADANLLSLKLNDAEYDSKDNKNTKIKTNKNTNEVSVQVDTTPAGIRLTIQNLQFKADSAELLPGEEKHLDKICEVLKLCPDSQFLVEGHTAKTGNDKGEMKLSIERSREIAKALAKRGIPEGKFICKGSGGTKPVADNSTSEGKAKNRRVEITILE